MRFLFGVSCPTDSACVAVGAGAPGPAVIAGVGRHDWRVGNVGGQVSALLVFYGVSCPSTSRCVAVSDGGPYLSTDGGVTWSQAKLPPDYANYGAALNAVSCASARTCVAAGDPGIFTSVDGGAKWTFDNSVTAPAERSISCKESTCVAVAGQALVSSDGGRSWREVGTGAVSSLVAVSCASGSYCVAVGAGGKSSEEGAVFTTNGGQSWAPSDAPPQGVVDAVSCPSTNTCLASGANAAGTGGAVFRTSDGGRHWSSVTAPPGARRLYGIECITNSRCVVVGAGLQSIFFTNDAGTTWQ